ncbi:unnamed protein product [Symbiodinium microadriaticum]|nr:unnamed protein product [Symbiodinium microadriaticum]CAE7845518.1 unnamed protein product [Symbiodinium sp. KB8]
MKHFFDIIYDYDGHVNPDALSPILRDKAWDELPVPFGLKKPLGVEYLLQVFILPQVNGKHCIVKHIYVTKDKIKASLIFEAVYGTASEVIWGNNAKNTKKALQFMLENLGGTQFRLFSLTPDCKKSTKSAVMEKSEEELEKGFEFIREHGERDRGNLKQLVWIQKSIAGNTPIKGWRDGLVQKALDSLATDATMSKLITRYDLIIGDFEEGIQDLMQKLVPYLREHALWILGAAGKGKTPLGRVIAMMFSRYHGGTGSYRSGSDFDYFRGCPFTKKVSAIYDDGDIGLEPVKKKKAFSDVADTETLTKERWTAAKFVQNQLRVVIDNAFEPEKEQTISVDPNPTISHDQFLDIIRPAIRDMSTADIMAILKRSVFVVVGKEIVYWRLTVRNLASTTTATVVLNQKIMPNVFCGRMPGFKKQFVASILPMADPPLLTQQLLHMYESNGKGLHLQRNSHPNLRAHPSRSLPRHHRHLQNDLVERYMLAVPTAATWSLQASMIR